MHGSLIDLQLYVFEILRSTTMFVSGIHSNVRQFCTDWIKYSPLSLMKPVYGPDLHPIIINEY